MIVYSELTILRLQTLDDDFSGLEKGESEWPPSDLPDAKTLYAEFYEEIHRLARNIVCGSCGCIGHDEKEHCKEPITGEILALLKMDPSLVPFDFGSQHEVLNENQIMVDDLGISNGKISLCSSCHHSLFVTKKLPRDSLANYRWIGDIPMELQDLNWIEESLISGAHLIGEIVRLQNRNVTSYFALKGHQTWLSSLQTHD